MAKNQTNTRNLKTNPCVAAAVVVMKVIHQEHREVIQEQPTLEMDSLMYRADEECGKYRPSMKLTMVFQQTLAQMMMMMKWKNPKLLPSSWMSYVRQAGKFQVQTLGEAKTWAVQSIELVFPYCADLLVTPRSRRTMACQDDCLWCCRPLGHFVLSPSFYFGPLPKE